MVAQENNVGITVKARKRLGFSALYVPSLIFLVVCFAGPVCVMIKNSFDLQGETGEIVATWSLGNYIRFFSGGIYVDTLIATLRIGLITTVLAAILSYPVAYVIARGPALTSKIITLVLVSPLLVNIVTRTFGWRMVLARNGLVNYVVTGLGLDNWNLLYNEGAVIIGSLHLFLPLIALPIANSISAIPTRLEESAAALGARSIETFFKVILPLSLPGLGAGCVLVFTMTSSSFVLPAILGGDFSKMLGSLVEEQLLSVSNWPFGAAIATILMMLNLVVVVAYILLVEKRTNPKLRSGK
jgi:putative spermidine/putrescine transport system permease protein